MLAEAQEADLSMEEVRENLRERGKADLYFLSKGILGFTKMTPHLHRPIGMFLNDLRPHRKLLVLPRGFYKTSLATISHSVQLVIRDPNTTILIVNETQQNARRFLRKIQSVFERNEVFKWLYPEVIPDFAKVRRWSADEMQVPRELDYPEATIECMGMGAKTSRHFRHIKLDDLVSVAAAESQAVMDKAKDELAYAEPLLVNPAEDYIDYIGTRWGNDDVINHGIEEGLFDAQMIKQARMNGQPIFPEQYNDVRLREMERRIGPYKFSMLYQNDPYDEALADFRLEWLRWYEVDNHWSEQYGEIIIRVEGSREPIKVRLLDITMIVDPAKGRKKTDSRTAMTVVGQDMKGRKFILDAWAEHASPQRVVQQFVYLWDVWRPRTCGVESVGFQFMLADEFKKVRDAKRLDIGITELKTPTNVTKETRIRGLQPNFFRNEFYARRDQADLIDEYKKFPTGRHKDIMDSLAYHPQIWRAFRSPAVEQQFYVEEQAALAARPAGGY